MSRIETKAKEIYGTMSDLDPLGTAFILSDGSFLRRGHIYSEVTHDAMTARILEEATGRKCKESCIIKFMKETGAIRVADPGVRKPTILELDMVVSPDVLSPAQMETLAKVCSKERRCSTWIITPKGVACSQTFGGLREIVELLEDCKTQRGKR